MRFLVDFCIIICTFVHMFNYSACFFRILKHYVTKEKDGKNRLFSFGGYGVEAL